MDLQKLFEINRLFNSRPPSQFAFSTYLLTWFVFCLIGGLLVSFLIEKILPSKKQIIFKKFIRKIAYYYLTTSFIGLFLLFARTQYIAFFAMRFFLLLLLLIQIGMALYFVFEYKAEFPKVQKSFFAEIEKQKYIPKRKKK